MYLGLFFFPWMAMYALSTIVMNHRAYFVERYGPGPVPFERERAQTYDGSFPQDADLRVVSTEILDSLGLDGAHNVSRRKDGTIVINRNMAEEVDKMGSRLLPGTQLEKSAIFVPLVASDQARGLIELGDLTREDAYSPSDVRLLQTLANSMSVALENARLFAETQRRTRETAALVEVRW